MATHATAVENTHSLIIRLTDIAPLPLFAVTPDNANRN